MNAACAVCDRQRATMLHHIVRRSQLGSDDPSNLLPVCAECHTRIHNNTAWAQEMGYLKRSSV